MADEQLIAEALTEQGYTPTPKVGDLFRQTNASWLTDGQDRFVTITSIGNTVNGWQVRVEAVITDASGLVVEGPTRGLMYLDHLLGRTEFPGLFGRVA